MLNTTLRGEDKANEIEKQRPELLVSKGI